MTQSRIDAFRDGDVSRETCERLAIFESLLRKWTRRINLVAAGTVDHIWERHIHDSLQVFELSRVTWKHWTDLGTGGGFPGLIVAIRAAEQPVVRRITLVESDARKVAFLRAVLRETGVPADVKNARIERLEPLRADVITARALAGLPGLLSYAERHLKPEGEALFHKGASYKHELKSARETWDFRCEEFPSMTDPASVILRISELRRV